MPLKFYALPLEPSCDKIQMTFTKGRKMRNIEVFKKHLREKRAVKVISGIDNYDLTKVKKIAQAAQAGFASAIDVACDKDVIKVAKENCHLSVFASSINPFDLAKAVDLGVDAIEIGNFDAFYKKGEIISVHDVYEITLETMTLVQGRNTFICATIPGHIEMDEQIALAKRFELLGIDLIQTEGAPDDIDGGARKTLFAKAQRTIENTLEISRQVAIPVMSATGITKDTAPLAFAAGASAIGVGSCINKLDNPIEMVATVRNIVGAVAYNGVAVEVALEEALRM